MAKVSIDLNKKTKMKGFISSNKSNKATIWIDRGSGLVSMRTPFDILFVKAFSELVPKDDRGWDAENKVWKFASHYIDSVLELCEKYFETEMLPDLSSGGGESDYEKLLKHLSIEGLGKVWRMVALELHPDKGGDPELFIEAKDAYEKLAKGHKK